MEPTWPPIYIDEFGQHRRHDASGDVDNDDDKNAAISVGGQLHTTR